MHFQWTAHVLMYPFSSKRSPFCHNIILIILIGFMTTWPLLPKKFINVHYGVLMSLYPVSVSQWQSVCYCTKILTGCLATWHELGHTGTWAAPLLLSVDILIAQSSSDTDTGLCQFFVILWTNNSFVPIMAGVRVFHRN